MDKRFAILIGVAAAGVMALGAQTTAAAPDVVKYDTELTIAVDRGSSYHGDVNSEVRKCKRERRVILFKQRPGADRKVGTARSSAEGERGVWGGRTGPQRGDVYAKVRRELGDGFVCRADRSKTLTRPGEVDRSEPLRIRGLAATSTAGPVDRVPPDLQLSGPTKQSQAIVPPSPGEGWRIGCDRGYCVVRAKVGCGDEACTARANGKLTKVKNGKLKPWPWRRELDRGEPNILLLHLTLKTRKQALKALDNGENVQAKVTVRATDAAGNVATAKRTIKIVK